MDFFLDEVFLLFLKWQIIKLILVFNIGTNQIQPLTTEYYDFLLTISSETRIYYGKKRH